MLCRGCYKLTVLGCIVQMCHLQNTSCPKIAHAMLCAGSTLLLDGPY